MTTTGIRSGTRRTRRHFAAFAAIAFVVVGARADAAAIDARKSEITATFRQMNVPVDGRFTRVRGKIEFAPDRPAAARAEIEVDTASIDVGAPEYNDELQQKEWFDSATYPRARFVTTRVTSTGRDRFDAVGTLTLKGKAQKLRVPIARRRVGGEHIYEGEVPISRKAFGIGGAAWDDTVADRVIVKFRIVSP